MVKVKKTDLIFAGGAVAGSLLYALLLAGLDLYWRRGQESIILGMSMEDGWERTGEWLLLILPVLAGSGIRSELRKRMAPMTLHRYGSWKRWNLTLAAENLAECAIYACCLGVVFMNLAGGQRVTLWVIPILFIHFVFLVNVFWLIQRLTGNTTDAAGCVLMVYGLMIFFLHRKSGFLICFWGMYKRYVLAGEFLGRAALLIQGAASVLIFVFLWKKGVNKI